MTKIIKLVHSEEHIQDLDFQENPMFSPYQIFIFSLFNSLCRSLSLFSIFCVENLN